MALSFGTHSQPLVNEQGAIRGAKRKGISGLRFRVCVQAMAETAPLNATEIRCSSDPQFRFQSMIKLSSAKKNGNERKHNEILKLLTTAQQSCGATTELRVFTDGKKEV